MKSSEINTWKRQSGYVWSLMGSAVGFANIITFSAQCYRNGGGAFLIPFIVAMIILGLPMLYLEALIGYRWKKPLVSSYGKVCNKWLKMFGWLAVFACTTIGGFYIVLTGYSIAYIGFAAARVIPEDTETFFLHKFLHLSSDITQFNDFSWIVFIATLIVVVFTAYVMLRGIRDGIERICSIFLPILLGMIVIMTLAVGFLPGAMLGWKQFLAPDFSKLFDVHLWRDVFGHLFFSFSLGLGIIVGYSRHTGQKVNIVKAMRWVAFGDFAISFIAGLAVFGGIGYMSHFSGIPFKQIVSSDSIFQIGFVVFPNIIKLFGPVMSQIVGVLFFFCIFVAGITGVFSIVESVVGNIECEFGQSRHTAIAIALMTMTGLSFFFCMGNGLHIVEALVPMVMGVNMLIGGIVQIIVFAWISKEVKRSPLWDTDWQMKCSYWMLAGAAPILLLVILIGNVLTDLKTMDLPVAIRWSWLITATFLGWICVVWSQNKDQVVLSSKLKIHFLAQSED